MEVFLEKAELFIRSVCVLHNFIINENKNGDEAFLREGATEPRIENLSNLTCNVAIRPTACALEVRQKFTDYFTSLVRTIQWQNNYVQ
jgi:hypothetical protein